MRNQKGKLSNNKQQPDFQRNQKQSGSYQETDAFLLNNQYSKSIATQSKHSQIYNADSMRIMSPTNDAHDSSHDQYENGNLYMSTSANQPGRTRGNKLSKLKHTGNQWQSHKNMSLNSPAKSFGKSSKQYQGKNQRQIQDHSSPMDKIQSDGKQVLLVEGEDQFELHLYQQRGAQEQRHQNQTSTKSPKKKSEGSCFGFGKQIRDQRDHRHAKMVGDHTSDNKQNQHHRVDRPAQPTKYQSQNFNQTSQNHKEYDVDQIQHFDIQDEMNYELDEYQNQQQNNKMIVNRSQQSYPYQQVPMMHQPNGQQIDKLDHVQYPHHLSQNQPHYSGMDHPKMDQSFQRMDRMDGEHKYAKGYQNLNNFGRQTFLQDPHITYAGHAGQVAHQNHHFNSRAWEDDQHHFRQRPPYTGAQYQGQSGFEYNMNPSMMPNNSMNCQNQNVLEHQIPNQRITHNQYHGFEDQGVYSIKYQKGQEQTQQIHGQGRYMIPSGQQISGVHNHSHQNMHQGRGGGGRSFGHGSERPYGRGHHPQPDRYNLRSPTYNFQPPYQQDFRKQGGHSGSMHDQHRHDDDYQKSVHYYFDLYSKNFDNLYREPKDGMISLRKNDIIQTSIYDEFGLNAKNQNIDEIPLVELVTLIDLSTLWEDKQKLAGFIAQQLFQLCHPNLLNITRNLRYLDNHIPKGFLQFSSEAPDHISSWKSFCKRPFDLSQILSIFRQLCEGICHIHESGMIFRDVHPTRIHLNQGVIKFNLVGMPYNFKKLLKNESFSGHLNYSAPEILEHGQENYLTPKVDVWSLGCCLYYLVTKRDPFDGQNPTEIKKNIKSGKLDRYKKDFGKDDKGEDRHPILEKLLNQTMTVDIDKRPSSAELLNIIDSIVYQYRDIFDEFDEIVQKNIIINQQNNPKDNNQDSSSPSKDYNKDKFNQFQEEGKDPLSISRQSSHNMGSSGPSEFQQHYNNKIMNKNIPQFFVKRNNFEKIFIKALPFYDIMMKYATEEELQEMKERAEEMQRREERAEAMNARGDREQNKGDMHFQLMQQTKQPISSNIGQQDKAASMKKSLKRNPSESCVQDTRNRRVSAFYIQGFESKIMGTPQVHRVENDEQTNSSPRNSVSSPSSSSENSQSLTEDNITVQSPNQYSVNQQINLLNQIDEDQQEETERVDRDQLEPETGLQVTTVPKLDVPSSRVSPKNQSSIFSNLNIYLQNNTNEKNRRVSMRVINVNNEENKIQIPLNNLRQMEEVGKQIRKYVASPGRQNSNQKRIRRGSQTSQISWGSKNSGISRRIKRMVGSNQVLAEHSPLIPRNRGLNLEFNIKQIEASSPLVKPMRNGLVEDPQISNSIDSVGNMTQEMIDLVDNLIDTSPKSRQELYEKSKFALKIKPTNHDQRVTCINVKNVDGDGEAENEVQSPPKRDFSSMVSSVGILKYESGDIYEGQLLNGRRSGFGKMKFINGDEYEGIWKQDQMCDPDGHYKMQNGDEYKGSFKTCSKLVSKLYGCFDGQGEYTFYMFGILEGKFQNGLVNGPGKFTFNDGQVEEGSWYQLSTEQFKELMQEKKKI